MSLKEKKEENMKNEKKKSNKKIPLIIGGIVGVAIIGIIAVVILMNNSNSIKGQFDKILKSNETEIIFFERKGKTENDDFKKLLDNELKEQGVVYTTIDITNASYDDLEYIKEKLNITRDEFDVYIAAIRGSENLSLINYNDYDRTMFLLANKQLLKDSELILNDHYYKIGKEALEKGILGEAKDNFEKCKGYLDTDEILKYKRFYLVDNDFEYDYNDVRLSLSYNGGFLSTGDDSITVSYQDCRTLASCFDGRIQQWDAIMLNDNRISIRQYNSSKDAPFNDYLNIEIVSENQIKLGFEGRTYTLNKTN